MFVPLNAFVDFFSLKSFFSDKCCFLRMKSCRQITISEEKDEELK